MQTMLQRLLVETRCVLADSTASRIPAICLIFGFLLSLPHFAKMPDEQRLTHVGAPKRRYSVYMTLVKCFVD